MDISIHVDAYLYGEGEIVKATPEEVAYMYKRIENILDQAVGDSAQKFYSSAVSFSKQQSLFDYAEDEEDDEEDSFEDEEEMDENDPFYFSDGMQL